MTRTLVRPTDKKRENVSSETKVVQGISLIRERAQNATFIGASPAKMRARGKVGEANS
jgi:hypothetical protein